MFSVTGCFRFITCYGNLFNVKCCSVNFRKFLSCYRIAISQLKKLTVEFLTILVIGNLNENYHALRPLRALIKMLPFLLYCSCYRFRLNCYSVGCIAVRSIVPCCNSIFCLVRYARMVSAGIHRFISRIRLCSRIVIIIHCRARDCLIHTRCLKIFKSDTLFYLCIKAHFDPMTAVWFSIVYGNNKFPGSITIF